MRKVKITDLREVPAKITFSSLAKGDFFYNTHGELNLKIDFKTSFSYSVKGTLTRRDDEAVIPVDVELLVTG